MVNVGIFMTIWNILWPFGIIYGRLVEFVVICYIFPQFGMFGPRKIWQPWLIYCSFIHLISQGFDETE
jgi:hypothetical protein